MWTWIVGNSEPLNVIVNAAMLVVWALYFQLLLNGYRRSRSSKILINRANGHTPDTQCVITNMSVEAIYIEGVIAELRLGDAGQNIICSLTDRGGSVDPKQISQGDGYQGPLGSGEAVELGSYEKIIAHALQQEDADPADVRHLTLTVVATYGPEDRPVAAQREYDFIDTAGGKILCSDRVITRQIHSSSERRRIEWLMQEELSSGIVDR